MAMFGMFGEVKAAGFESTIAVMLRIAKLHAGMPLEKQSIFKVLQVQVVTPNSACNVRHRNLCAVNGVTTDPGAHRLPPPSAFRCFSMRLRCPELRRHLRKSKVIHRGWVKFDGMVAALCFTCWLKPA